MRPLSGQALRVACFGVPENMDCACDWGVFGPSKNCCPLWMFVLGVQQLLIPDADKLQKDVKLWSQRSIVDVLALSVSGQRLMYYAREKIFVTHGERKASCPF